MSENVGASTSRNPKGLHDLYRKNFAYVQGNEQQGNDKYTQYFGMKTPINLRTNIFKKNFVYFLIYTEIK
jgi:hypothetical protein